MSSKRELERDAEYNALMQLVVRASLAKSAEAADDLIEKILKEQYAHLPEGTRASLYRVASPFTSLLIERASRTPIVNNVAGDLLSTQGGDVKKDQPTTHATGGSVAVGGNAAGPIAVKGVAIALGDIQQKVRGFKDSAPAGPGQVLAQLLEEATGHLGKLDGGVVDQVKGVFDSLVTLVTQDADSVSPSPEKKSTVGKLIDAIKSLIPTRSGVAAAFVGTLERLWASLP